VKGQAAPRPSSRPTLDQKVGRGIADRIREAGSAVGSLDALSQEAGIPRSTLTTWLTGKVDVPISGIRAIGKVSGLSIHYLATGEGPKLPFAGAAVAGTTAREADETHYRISAADERMAGLVYLPLYDVRAAAGRNGIAVSNGEHVSDELAFKEDWIRRELRVSPADLRLIYVEGDSMEPDLRAGDVILIDHSDTLARREGIYVIRMDDALLVKQLQRMPGGLIKVISRNPAYEPFTIAAEKIQGQNGFGIVGRVVWACRRF
jgi:phage repressor protein C with HTH and peptisase S24 domain